MLRYKRYVLYTVLIFISCSWFLFYLPWLTTDTELIEESSWSCKGEGRSTICEFTNFCIDSRNGPFIIHPTNKPPKINMINSGPEDDTWLEPKRMSNPVHAVRVDKPLFVYGLYSPFHFSHFLYNGLIPLFSTMMEYYATPNAWTMRYSTMFNRHTTIDFVLPSDKDIVLDSKDVLTDRQIQPGRVPVCFSKAVVGTGNRCSLWYCEKHIPATHYASYKEYVFHQPFQKNNTCLTSIIQQKTTGKYRVGLLNRKHSRHITNYPELIERLEREKDFAIEILDFDQSACDIIHTAQAVKDLDILIAPYGNGLGAGLFMKDDAALIAISARWHNEDWFKYPMTAIGRRIFNFECKNEACQVHEIDFATSILKGFGITLNETQMHTFLTELDGEKVLPDYDPNSFGDTPLYLYRKDVARRIDVDRFIPYLRMVIKNKPPKDMPYPKTCEKENVCCDTDCYHPLNRNILTSPNPWQLN